MKTPDTTADVIVVGAGPAGTGTAAHLARAGLDVVLLEKTAFPRDKICGDALTPRAVHELTTLGFELPETQGWHKNRGLRLIGAGHRLELDWPDIPGMPNYGLTRARMDLDEALARHAEAQGAVVHERTSVNEPLFGKDGWVRGVRAVRTDERGRKTGETIDYHAPIVVAADGVSSRTAVKMGIERHVDRPMGVAVRTYYSSPRHADPYIESWLELREPDRNGQLGEPMPGYGWLFPLGNGNINVGLGILNTSPQFRTVDYKRTLSHWIEAMGHEWAIDETTMIGTVKSAALPMAFNRTPHFQNGVLLVGDAGGMVNPFNGEGIDYALECARIAADVIATHHNYPDPAKRLKLQEYPARVRAEFGSYFTLGRGFAHVIGRPELMALGLKYGMGSDALMKFVVKLLANLYRHSGKRDINDYLIAALQRLVPATQNE